MKYFNLKKLLKHQKVHVDFIEINRQKMTFYWDKFIILFNICENIDKNSEEYTKLNRLAWDFMGRYIELLLQGYTDFKYNNNTKKGLK